MHPTPRLQHGLRPDSVHHAQLIGGEGLALERGVESAGQRALTAAVALQELGELLEGVERWVVVMGRRLEACLALGLTAAVTAPAPAAAAGADTRHTPNATTTPARRRADAHGAPVHGWGDDEVDPAVLTAFERLAGEGSLLPGALRRCHVALGRVLRDVERRGGLVLRRAREDNPAAADYTGDIPFGDIGFSSKTWVEVDAAVDEDVDVRSPKKWKSGGGGTRRSNSTPVSPVVLRRRGAGAGAGAGTDSLRSPLRSPYSSVSVASSPSFSSAGGRRGADEPLSPMCLLRDKLSARLKL